MASPRGVWSALWWYSLFIGFYWVVGTAFQFYYPVATQYNYSYELSDPPGTLVSARWSYRFVVDCMFVLLWAVPFSAALMLVYRGIGWTITLHLVVDAILFLWFLLVLLYPGTFDYVHANSTDPAYFGNPAHDPRWCCLYGVLPGTPCIANYTLTSCIPTPAAADLVVNPLFVFRFWFNFVLVLMIAVDFFLTLLMFKRAITQYQVELLKEQADEESPPEEEEEEEEEKPVSRRIPLLPPRRRPVARRTTPPNVSAGDFLNILTSE